MNCYAAFSWNDGFTLWSFQQLRRHAALVGGGFVFKPASLHSHSSQQFKVMAARWWDAECGSQGRSWAGPLSMFQMCTASVSACLNSCFLVFVRLNFFKVSLAFGQSVMQVARSIGAYTYASTKHIPKIFHGTCLHQDVSGGLSWVPRNEQSPTPPSRILKVCNMVRFSHISMAHIF